MSTVFVQGVNAFNQGLTKPESSNLAYYVMAGSYQYNPSQDLQQIISNSLQTGVIGGRTVTSDGEVIMVAAARPRFLASGTYSGVVVADQNLGVPIVFLPTRALTVSGTQIFIRWTVFAQYRIIYGFTQWLNRKYNAAITSGARDVNPDHSKAPLDDQPGGWVNTFSLVKTGKIIGFRKSSQFFDLATQDRDVRNIEHTQKRLQINSGSVNTFSIVGPGKIYGFDKPTIEPGTADLDFYWGSVDLIPKIRTSRVSSTAFDVDIQINPGSPYKIKLFRSNDYGYLQATEIADLAVGSLPYSDTGVPEGSNPKYFGFFYIDVEVDAAPTTSRGSTGEAEMIIQPGNRI